ncbi:exchange factor for Arf 6 isoform X2 [Rhodnius prolixus]|uniref:exchange factor for Arf 6 isoform X2 n=1 Tax=Rhodnius prolixus TaxID=13249 RepID=UPI003D18ABBE
MAEELLVVLNKKDPTCGLGFSLLGTPGLPPIIYDIVENSPAAESGNVEAGDVILKVNETDVNRLNTKEVLKCLRLCENPVSLKLKRDPVVKARVRHYLSLPVQYRGEMNLPELISEAGDSGDYSPPPIVEPPPPVHPPPLEDVTRTNGDAAMKGSQPKFEAFVMTGDRVLKICRTQQGSVLPKQQRKVDSLRNNMHNYNNHQRHNSVPTSPIEAERHPKLRTNSAGTSPTPPVGGPCPVGGGGPASLYVVRTSKSEDHLQSNKDSLSAVSIEIDDDVTSSLNTLLDTRQETETEDQRIVWTYNAPPLTDSSTEHTTSSPHRSGSPASPTSVSSSVMSSSTSSDSDKRGVGGSIDAGRLMPGLCSTQTNNNNTDLSQSEAVSNISSPDFIEEDSEIIAKDLVMEVSDPSDSDSTLLVSETTRRKRAGSDGAGEHRIVIQVKGPDKQSDSSSRSNSPRGSGRYKGNTREMELYSPDNYEDDERLVQLTEGAANLAKSVSPPPVASGNVHTSGGEEDSDVESLHSYHYSPKAVDIPSAVRLAKRLYTLDGFKKSDVSRHLSKNNEFSRAVAEEYLKYFSFGGDTLDGALRKFLTQFCLTGETQERERVLVHFSKRYLDCNPGIYSSQDAVHTLTCAIMLLNTDLHGQTIGRKMTCNEFIDNLSELNDGDNFPKEILKNLYQSIKNYPLEWALDDDTEDQGSAKVVNEREGSTIVQTSKGLFDVPSSAAATEYKKGYVMRKCCVEPNGKKTPLGKRGWKMYYCTLRDLVLYLHKDEHGFRKTQFSDNLHNAIRIHHSMATKANDYTKKLHVFRLETADQAVYLFQTSDSKELQSWIDTINFVCASFSAQPLPGAVGSQKKFQRPLLPSSLTKLNLREQLRDHETVVQRLELELESHRKHPPERGSKQLVLYNFREKDNYLQYELKRYKLYVYLLRSRMCQLPDMIEGSVIESIGESCEEQPLTGEDQQRRSGSPATNSLKMLIQRNFASQNH